MISCDVSSMTIRTFIESSDLIGQLEGCHINYLLLPVIQEDGLLSARGSITYCPSSRKDKHFACDDPLPTL